MRIVTSPPTNNDDEPHTKFLPIVFFRGSGAPLLRGGETGAAPGLRKCERVRGVAAHRAGHRGASDPRIAGVAGGFSGRVSRECDHGWHSLQLAWDCDRQHPRGRERRVAREPFCARQARLRSRAGCAQVCASGGDRRDDDQRDDRRHGPGLAGLANWSDFGAIWRTWFGDAAGALLVAPLLITWAANPRLEWDRRRMGEAGAAMAALLIAGGAMFGEWFPFTGKSYPLLFLLLPLLVWVGCRFQQRETATAMFVLSAIAIAGTLRGHGPFALPTPTNRSSCSRPSSAPSPR